MIHPLTDIQQIDDELEPYLEQVGDIFQAFRLQDSTCVSYGVRVGAESFFVKHSCESRGVASLRRAVALNRAVEHPALPRLHNSFGTPLGGLALVYDWAPGEVLYDYTLFRGERRTAPFSPLTRFRGQPVDEIQRALTVIYDVHQLLAEKGYIAVDFYDGCMLYDFDTRKLHLCDLDEYRHGQFTNEVGRLPGSKRYMAPEEFQQGQPIDQVTNVFTLGRAAFELLADGTTAEEKWRGTKGQYPVAKKAVAEKREERYASVKEYVEAWRYSTGG
jgi:serine/threonine protein kinase, bacterial